MTSLAIFGSTAGGGEILVILLAVLLLFGAKRLPETARMLGKALAAMRKSLDDVRREIEDSAKVPTIGKDDQKSSNDWKNPPEKFQ
ncbi:MAG: twin-arginine translocase TatA/TatE family subunit [Kiritimatiellia bacterium]